MPFSSEQSHATHQQNLTVVLIIAFFLTAYPSTAGTRAPDCNDAIDLSLEAQQYGYAGIEEPIQRLRLQLPTPGIISLDASTGDAPETLSQLDLSESSCVEIAEATILEQTPARLLLAVHTPGTLFFHIANRDPRLPLGPYQVTTRFVAARIIEETLPLRSDGVGLHGHSVVGRIGVTRFYASESIIKSDPMEVDPDPGMLAQPASVTRFNTKSDPMEVDPDPGALAQSLATFGEPGLLATIVTLSTAPAPEINLETDGLEPPTSTVLEQVIWLSVTAREP